MRNAIVTALLCLLPAASGCSSANVDTVWDTQFDFAAGNTFDWAPKTAETGGQLDYDSIERAVKSTVEAHLRSVGFRLSSDNPSLLVTYYVGLEELSEVGEAYYGRGWGGYWGWGWYGPAGLNMSQYEGGTITIDFLSPDPDVGMVWRGIARAELSRGAQSTGRIESAIRDVLEDFPPPDDD